MNAQRPSKITGTSVIPCAVVSAAVSVPANETAATYPCLECSGEGEAEYMGLDETRYTVRDCHVCDGTGLVAPYCEVCEGRLVDGWCASCEDYGLVYVERIAPGRIAL